MDGATGDARAEAGLPEPADDGAGPPVPADDGAGPPVPADDGAGPPVLPWDVVTGDGGQRRDVVGTARRARSRESSGTSVVITALPPVAVGLSTAVFYGVLTVIRFDRFRAGLDLALFGQSVRGYASGQGPISPMKSIRPFSLLGDHFSPVIALLGPLYRLWPHVQVLLVAQSVLFGIAAGMLTAMAVRSFGPVGGALIGVGYALSRGTSDAALSDFHEIAFAVPLLLWALDAVRRGRDRQVIVACALLMLVKEDSAFLIAGIGLWLLARRRWRDGVAYLAAGVGAWLLMVFVVIPQFSLSGRYGYLVIYAADRPQGDVLAGIWAGEVATLWSSRFGVMVVALLLPTLGLALLSPAVLVVLPSILVRAAVPDQYNVLGFHYGATIAAVLFVAALDARDRGQVPPALSGRYAWPVLCVILVWPTLTAAPSSPLGQPDPWQCPQCAIAEKAVALVPDGVDVVADAYLSPHLTDRATVRLLQPRFTALNECLAPQYVIADLDSMATGDSAWIRPQMDKLTSTGTYVPVLAEGRYVVLKAVDQAAPQVPEGVCQPKK